MTLSTPLETVRRYLTGEITERQACDWFDCDRLAFREEIDALVAAVNGSYLTAERAALAPTPPDNRVAPGQPNPVAPGSQPSATAPATALREALDREQRAWMVHGDRWEDEEVGSIIDRLRAALEADHD